LKLFGSSHNFQLSKKHTFSCLSSNQLFHLHIFKHLSPALAFTCCCRCCRCCSCDASVGLFYSFHFNKSCTSTVVDLFTFIYFFLKKRECLFTPHTMCAAKKGMKSKCRVQQRSWKVNRLYFIVRYKKYI
jgi:hypothetical protein